jgi:amidase
MTAGERAVTPSPDLVFTSASGLAAAIRARQVSSAEVMEAHLRRIEAVNPAINALVQIDAERALGRARAADAALARGDCWGPLHGVPFTAKDVCETAGIVSAAGLEERRGFVPERDAVVVARLKAAGGILLGKSNCPPGGGGGDTDNPVYGRTNNPYDTSCTPGGSSGGEAAAVAAGLSPLGIGSDSGGSIRLPAHYCGVAGLKPSSGRVPNTGLLNHPGGLSDPRTQVGPIARTVRDLALAFHLLVGEDGVDSGVLPLPMRDMAAVQLPGVRVAFYTDDGQAPTAPAVEATVRAAAACLQDAGLILEETLPDCLTDSRPITERYWSMDTLNGEQVQQLFLDWDRFRTAMLAFLGPYDAILCPADAAPAPRHGEELGLRFNYTLPFSLCGWPCTVVRAGGTAEGLPVGIQVTTPVGREDVALAIAALIEDRLGGWGRPPI